MALAANEGANLPAFTLRRMIERFGANGQMREALLRTRLAARFCPRGAGRRLRPLLTELAVERHWLTPDRAERVAKDSTDSALMIIAAGAAAYSDETAVARRLSARLWPIDRRTGVARLALRPDRPVRGDVWSN